MQSSCWLYNGFLSTVHGNDLSGPTGQVASPLYPRSYRRYGVFSWRIMVDTGKAVVISFHEFFIDAYSSNCYSYVAVSNKVYSAIFVCTSQIKRVAAFDGLSWWEFKLNNYKILDMKCLLKMHTADKVKCSQTYLTFCMGKISLYVFTWCT